jgi:hypothetical protein
MASQFPDELTAATLNRFGLKPEQATHGRRTEFDRSAANLTGLFTIPLPRLRP